MKSPIDKILHVALAVTLLSCIPTRPYLYYTIVRYAAMGYFFYLFISEQERPYLKLVWIISAILINPMVKFVMTKGVWNLLDVTWAIILIISSIDFRSPQKP